MNLENNQLLLSNEGQLRAVMNNFWIRLPDTYYPPILGHPTIASGYHRELVRNKIDYVIGTKLKPPDQVGHSERYLNQTFRDFFVGIDSLIIASGLEEQIATCFIWLHDPERIKQESRYLEIPVGDECIPLEERLLAYQERVRWRWSPLEVSRAAFPVFHKMLEAGYAERDLIS